MGQTVAHAQVGRPILTEDHEFIRIGIDVSGNIHQVLTHLMKFAVWLCLRVSPRGELSSHDLQHRPLTMYISRFA